MLTTTEGHERNVLFGGTQVMGQDSSSVGDPVVYLGACSLGKHYVQLEGCGIWKILVLELFFFHPNQTLLGCASCFSEVNFT